MVGVPIVKPRHAAALISVGWYLMVPPVAKWTPFLLKTNKPFAQWETRQSFDTAQRCKEAQHKIKAFLKSEAAKRLKEAGSQKAYLEDPIAQMLFAEQAKIATSKCVATDDPRLAK